MRVQNYIKDKNDYFLGYNNTDAPYLDTKQNGYSVGYRYRAGKHLTLNYGFEAPMQISDNDFEGKNTSLLILENKKGVMINTL